ncbi:hypothetical protein EDB80DRAFT_446947 [Ilyonectria destructans]|nr:hypothetical protein EDB80DRAFT_446947 [Ilyonectria destructans]
MVFNAVRQSLNSERNNHEVTMTLMMWDLKALRDYKDLTSPSYMCSCGELYIDTIRLEQHRMKLGCDPARLVATPDVTRPPNSEATLGCDLEQQPLRCKVNQESHRKRRHSIPLEDTTPKHSSAFSHRDTQLPDGTSMLEDQDFDGLGDLEGGPEPHWPAGERPAKRWKWIAVQPDANPSPSPGRDTETSVFQSPVHDLAQAAQAAQAALALVDSALPSDDAFGSIGNAERAHTAGPLSTTDSIIVERTQRDNVCTPRPVSEDKGDRLAAIDNHSAQLPTIPDPDQGRQSIPILTPQQMAALSIGKRAKYEQSQLPLHLSVESQALASHSDNAVLVDADASPPSRSCQKKSHLPAQIAQAQQDLCDKNRELGYAQGVQREREKEYKKTMEVLEERWSALREAQRAVHEAAEAVGKNQEELADAQKAREAKQDAVDKANIRLKRVSTRSQRPTNR